MGVLEQYPSAAALYQALSLAMSMLEMAGKGKSPRAKSIFDGLDNSLSVTSTVLRYQENDLVFQLDTVLKSEYETVFGVDFSEVRIHTGHYANELAREANALALTIGNDIYFAAGRYEPHTEEGKSLLVHELAHVVGNQKEQRLVYLEDVEAAEYAGAQAEAAVAGLGLHTARYGELRSDETPSLGTGAETADAFAGGLIGDTGSGRSSVSLGDFSASGGGMRIEYTSTKGEKINLSVEEYRQVIEQAVSSVQEELRQARMLGDDQAYESLVLKHRALWSGRM